MDTPSTGYLRGFHSLELERTEPTPLEVDGQIPPELRGTLYRIGPARHDIYGERLAHWFDGDGMVHAIELREGSPRYLNRFVQHTAHVEEDAAQQRLYGSFGTPAPGSRFNRFRRRKQRRNPANTNVIVHDGKLLALCEGGRPWHLDPADLSTIGEEVLGGALDEDEATFSAHPCVDPATGELWNFGAVFGRQPQLHFYRWPKGGSAVRTATVALPFPALVHDFALTATSLVVVASPMVTPTIPFALMLGQTSFGEALTYKPELGVYVGIIDRESGHAHWHRTDPFLCFHIANAYDDPDTSEVVVDLSAYKDGNFLSIAFELMRGPIQTGTLGEIRRLRVDRGGRPVRSTTLLRHSFEFPRVLDDRVSRSHRIIYGLTWDDPKDMPRRPSAFDVETGELTQAPLIQGQWAGECVPVAKAGATSERDAWLLSVVLDAKAGASELQIFDGADLASGSIARIRLPHIMPFGFHGNWVAAPG